MVRSLTKIGTVFVARAGDVGKGFAIVAEETRNHSQSVVNSAKEQLSDVENNLKLVNILNELSVKLETLIEKFNI